MISGNDPSKSLARPLFHIRLRAWMAGVIFALFICAITPFNNAFKNGTPLAGGHFPLTPFLFFLPFDHLLRPFGQALSQKRQAFHRQGAFRHLDAHGPGFRHCLHRTCPDLFHQPHRPPSLRHPGKPMDPDPCSFSAQKLVPRRPRCRADDLRRVGKRAGHGLASGAGQYSMACVGRTVGVVVRVYHALLFRHGLFHQFDQPPVAGQRAHELSSSSSSQYNYGIL